MSVELKGGPHAGIIAENYGRRSKIVIATPIPWTKQNLYHQYDAQTGEYVGPVNDDRFLREHCSLWTRTAAKRFQRQIEKLCP